MADLERIAQAIENLEDDGYSKTIDFGVETYNLISCCATEISEKLASNGSGEVDELKWEYAAMKLKEIYLDLLKNN